MFTRSLIERALAVIAAHNEGLEDKSLSIVLSYEDCVRKLNGFGATTDDHLNKRMTWEQIRDTIGVPILVAQDIAAVFRGGAPIEASQTTMLVRTMSDEVSEMSNRDLIMRHAERPNAMHNAVAEQIRARSGSNPCIVFNEDGRTLNVEETIKVLDGIQQGDSFGEIIRTPDGSPQYLYAVGIVPGMVRDEHPIFVGEALKSDGTDSFGIFWGSVPLENRQILRCAKEIGELETPNSKIEMIELRDRAMRMETITEWYQGGFRSFLDRKQMMNLPSLRVRAGRRQHAHQMSSIEGDSDNE